MSRKMAENNAAPPSSGGRGARRNIQRTVFEARQRLTSSSGTRASYDFEILSEYVSSRLSGKWGLPVLMIVLATFASAWTQPYFAAAWGGAVILTNIIVTLMCRRFLKMDSRSFDAKRWTTSFVAAEAVYGISWSLLVLIAWNNPNENAPVIVFALLLIGMAANTVLSRSLPAATLVSTVPATLVVCASLLLSGQPLNLSLTAIAILGQIFFIFLARQLNTSELGNLAHQSEKDALIFELEEARNMSEEARRHAEQANVAKSNFLATMSHELRTPLNAIIGFSEVLKSELLGEHQVPQYKEYAGDIHSSGQHLLNLINELLDLSRIEAGKYELNEEAVSLLYIAEDCKRMLGIRAKAKGVELLEKFDDDLPKIWGDERAIRQIILNLLSNAIKFTPQAGQIELIVTRTEDGGQLVSVKDNGPGIPESEIATVLSSFGQGSLAQKTAEQGAGLGLPIVQKIMELHQGRFDLFSKLRFGTEAIATFPRARVMDAVAAVRPPKSRLRIYPTSSSR